MSAYTQAFIRTQVGGNWNVYYVPQGYRAIVKTLTVANVSGYTRAIYIRVAGLYVYIRTLQVGDMTSIDSMRAVAYGGEAIESRADGTDVHVNLSGYLFTDETGPRGPDLEQRPWEEVGQLPHAT